MNTWWTVMDLVLGDETKKAFRKTERGLAIVAESEMPAEIAAEAGQLMLELEALKSKLDKLNSAVAAASETTMWPVL